MSEPQPTCGLCKKVMTPENSKIAPEFFLCDECAAPPQPAPTSREEAIDRYADEHVEALDGIEPNAPPRQKGDLGAFLFDTLSAMNKQIAQELRQLP